MEEELERLKEEKAAADTRHQSSLTLVASLKRSRDELQQQLDSIRGERAEIGTETDPYEPTADAATLTFHPSSSVQTEISGEISSRPLPGTDVAVQVEEEVQARRLSVDAPPPSNIPAPRPPAQRSNSLTSTVLKKPSADAETQTAAVENNNVDALESARLKLRELEKQREDRTLDSSRKGSVANDPSVVAQLEKKIEELYMEIEQTAQAATVLERAVEQERDKSKRLEFRIRTLDDELASTRQKGAFSVAADVAKAQKELEEKVFGLDRELESERAMRRSLEAKYEEKLKLRAREIDSLEQEVRRLKKAGDQLPPVLQELDRVKIDFEEKIKQKENEIRRITAAFNATETERSKLEQMLSRGNEDMAMWESRVKKAEEIRWRAGMELAKAKAELDWRQRAEQERCFHLERMKDEVERLKTKLMKSEMRKLKVEESLDECVIELRSKKREIEQMRLKVDGLVDFFSNQSHRPFLGLAPPNVNAENRMNYGEDHAPWHSRY